MKQGRIQAFDIIRGYLLFMIIIDHVELYPSIFDYVTGRGRMFVSAAEGFFFISGLILAYIYRNRVQKGLPFKTATIRMWKRAVQLYFTSISLTLLFTYWAIHAGNGAVKDGLPTLVNWGHIIWRTVTLQYWFGWADFLPHYVVFMIFAPLVFWLLLRNRWWLVVILSVVLWRHRGLSFDAAWQILFYGGMVIGYYWNDLNARIAKLSSSSKSALLWSVTGLAIITLVASWLSVFVLSELNNHRANLNTTWNHIADAWDTSNTAIWHYFEKWTLEPGRIVLFGLWFSAVYIWTSRYAQAISRYTKGLFELLGRNSLFVYVSHAIVIFILRVRFYPQSHLVTNFLVSAGILAFLLGLTYARERYTALGFQSGIIDPLRGWGKRIVNVK